MAVLWGVLRLVFPLIAGTLADAATDFILKGSICPVTNTTIFCKTFWPTLAGMVVAALTYLRTHPNGLNGDASPDAVSKAFAAVKLAPQPTSNVVGRTPEQIAGDEKKVGSGG